MQASRCNNTRIGAIRAFQGLALAIAIGGLTAGAQAADLSLDDLKDVIPSVSAVGVSIYGTIDTGYSYESHGVPPSGAFYVGSDYTIYGSPFANKPISSLTNNALEQSKIGVKIEESFGDGWAAIGKLETGFNPAFGEISDACASLLRNNGKTYGQMDENGDGSRCGQAFNGEAYGGISNSSYGTLKIGRQNSLVLDGMSSYDPMNLSYAFSILGFSGTPGPGIGNTETARWDNSVKYIYQYGPVHVAGIYASGGQDTSLMQDGYAANLGGSYKGFSIDGYWTQENGAVSLKSIPNPANAGGGVSCVAGTSPASGTFCPNYLLGTITNNQAWDVMAKYTFEFGGGLKDETAGKLTLFAGYQTVDITNPDHDQQFYNGFNTIGGYQFVTTTSATPANAVGSTKTQWTAWTGARYDLSWGLSLTGAYYHWAQDAYLTGSNATCAAATATNAAHKLAGTFQGNPVASNCAGDYNQGAFLVDYTFNKHFDLYGGVSYTENGGGFNSAFLQNNDTTFATGLRLKF